ncbi:hypothetical protein MKEN_00474200 [Mycena kentingensis (nom. inval.)]|nr:hypothetical protein MKEN_00474200 [Mycena kentingensis (nom. inval.)]
MDVQPAVGRLEADLEQTCRERDQLRAENDKCKTQLARKRAEVEDLEKQVDDAAHAAIEDKKEIRGWKRKAEDAERKAEDAEAAARKEKETMQREMEQMRRKMSGMEDELRRLHSQGMGASTVLGGKDSPIDISDREDAPMKMERDRTSASSMERDRTSASSTTRASLQRATTHSKIPAPPIEISDDEAASVVKRESSKTESMDTESLFSPMMSPAPSSVLSETIPRASQSAGTKRRRPIESDADDSDAPPIASTSSGRPKRARASVNYRDSVSPVPSESLSVIGRSTPPPSKRARSAKKPNQTLKPSPVKKSPPARTKNAPNFPDSFLEQYLIPIAAFSISPDPDPTLFGSRLHINGVFGGGTGSMLAQITTSPMASGATEKITAAFPQHKFNPLLPERPGAPGIIFASRADLIVAGKIYRLFVPVKRQKTAVWMYMGDYVHTHAGIVPAEVWASQTNTVKRTWAVHLKGTKTGEYAQMREKLKTSEKELEKLVQALCSGDERVSIGIVQMRCVAYDHTFATHLRHAFDHPSAKVLEQIANKGKRRGRAAAKVASDDGSDEEESEDGDYEDEDEY